MLHSVVGCALFLLSAAFLISQTHCGGDDADAAKEQGNAAFKANNLDLAISLYTKAAGLEKESAKRAIILTNRSMVQIKKGEAAKGADQKKWWGKFE